MAVSFNEMAGSPRMSIGPNGFTAVRIFKIAWADWNEFAADLIGGWVSVGGTYQLLDPVPFPGVPNVFVESIDIAPFDPTAPDGQGEVTDIETGLNEYTQAGALVTARYRTIEQRNSNNAGEPTVPVGTILNYTAQSATEIMTVPGRGWQWAGDNVKCENDINPGVSVAGIVHNLSWSRVAAPPWTAIRNSTGTVNNGSFLGAAAETLLFTGANIRREFQFSRQDEGLFWTLDYTFHETGKTLSGATKGTWNQLFRPRVGAVGGDWEDVEILGGTKKIYETSDFSALFAFG